MADVCTDFRAQLRAFNGEDDHVHPLVHYSPAAALSKLLNSLKGVSTRRLRPWSRRNVPYGWMFDQNSARSARAGPRPTAFRPRRFGEDPLKQQGVDVDEAGLEEVEREHAGLGVLLVRAGQGAFPCRSRGPRSSTRPS
jgi:REP element-mobilizing transposase RayT